MADRGLCAADAENLAIHAEECLLIGEGRLSSNVLHSNENMVAHIHFGGWKRPINQRITRSKAGQASELHAARHADFGTL